MIIRVKVTSLILTPCSVFCSRMLLDKLKNIAKHHILTTRCVSKKRFSSSGCVEVVLIIFSFPVCRRIDRVIQELSDEIHDPLISCHWSSLSTETSSFASVYIGLENGVER